MAAENFFPKLHFLGFFSQLMRTYLHSKYKSMSLVSENYLAVFYKFLNTIIISIGFMMGFKN